MKTLVLIGLFIAVANAVPAPKVKSYIRVTQPAPITLADIVDWKTASKDVQTRLSKIVLGDGPALGEQRIYTSRAIAKVVRQSVPELNGVKIPSKITIENRGYEISKKAVVDTLTQRWKKVCSDCEFIFKSVSLPILPADAVGKTWRIESQGRLPKGSFTRRIEVNQDGGSPVVYWISGQVEIHRKVPVAKRSLDMGHRFNADDVVYKMRDVTFATDGIPDVVEIIGQKAKRSLRANDVIWYGYITREKALNRGDSVKITVGDDKWQLSLMGEAQQGGYIGDTIKVRNRKTKQVLSGVIVGKGEVAIQ